VIELETATPAHGSGLERLTTAGAAGRAATRTAGDRTRVNVLANLVGSGVTTVLQIACIPLYVKFLGVEAFGLVGLYTALQAAASVLDAALGTTANRELAALRLEPSRIREARDLMRTLECTYWLAGILAGAVIAACAPMLAAHWIQAQNVAQSSVVAAVALIGLVVALQWPAGLYSGALLGLEEQVRYNAIVVTSAVVRVFGSVIVLWRVSPTIEAFFVWQAIAGALQTALSAASAWRALDDSAPASFRLSELRRVWRFTAGMTGISILALLLTQTDKVVLSRMLTLTEFGYYTVAASVALALYRVIVPVSNAVFPRISQLVAQKSEPELARFYHRSAQTMAVIVLPVALVIAFFGSEVLALWTRNPAIVEHAHITVALLVLGTALNGLMTVPYLLQLANGWTQLSVVANTIAVIVLGPAIYFATRAMGGTGAAAAWVGLNIGYVLFGIPIMHRRLLVGEKHTWYVSDVGLPLAGAIVGAAGTRLVFSRAESSIAMATGVAIALALATALAVLTVPWMRREAAHRFWPQP
jgi:O-antigen/teichoic acid export membrane protein